MKIISKYKDFYDYLWIDGDPDLVYVRKEKVCFNLIGEKIPSDYDHKISSGIETWYLNDKPGCIDIIGFTFGIYPYVYTTPAISIKLNNLEYAIKIFSKAEINRIKELTDEKKQRDYVNEICLEFLKEYGDDAPKNLMFFKYFWGGSIYKSLSRFCWKVEFPDIFMKLQAPVFVMYNDYLINGVYEYINDIRLENKNFDKITMIKDITVTGARHPVAITNVCFNKLSLPITKYWYDDINTLNTYSDIENFLMTSKLEPEPKISNDGKIIAHGFDLKTSFRKM